MSRFLSGANLSAQYYQASYPSASTFSRLDKFLIHTTETRGWPGYGGGASAPNATYFPERREIRQHFDSNRSARALRDPSGTAVRENRDNVFQLEVICYSSYSLVERFGGLWVGDLTDTHMRDIAEIANQLHDDWDLPLQSSVRWREGRRTFYDDVRLSGPQFDAYRGILGHVHASGNNHWDPGGFRYSQLARHLTQMEDDMDLSDKIDLVNDKTGKRWWAGQIIGADEVTVQAALGYAAASLFSVKGYAEADAGRDAKILAELTAIRAALNGQPVDVTALAAELAPLVIPPIVAALSDEDGATPEQVEERVEQALKDFFAPLTAPDA